MSELEAQNLASWIQQLQQMMETVGNFPYFDNVRLYQTKVHRYSLEKISIVVQSVM